MVTALVPAVVVSAFLVLPTVLLGERLARRPGGRATGRQLLLSTAAGALAWPLFRGPGRRVGTVCPASAVLVTRHARRGCFAGLLVWGTVAIPTVYLLGLAGLPAGVIAP
ncbi:hypothetical protein [Streptomyces zaomyceticus]|uniref:hypothetical protein n=1 Tax=Streptomyces zaomyceticus TaxID=68286 RepID=UPI0034302A24